MSAFYRALRAIVRALLEAFYRLEPAVDPGGALCSEGPVMFVGNHPNGLIDPALVFVLARRPITFLAKAPLLSMPVLGWMLKGLGVLPVYRKQDDPTQMGKNAGTLDAASEALVQGRCITLFPEGKSHSEPQLQELKTGAARIALAAAERGAKVRIVPLGLTYSEKNRFKSTVHVEVGLPLEVARDEAVVALTQRIFEALRKVTLNLEQWEDLPLIETAESLYALKVGEVPADPERLKAFARGMALMRGEQPERFVRLKEQVLSLRRRLKLLDLSPQELSTRYSVWGVTRFILKNLAALVTLPLFVVGMVLFAVPYWVPPAVVRLFRVPTDVQATVKLLLLWLLAPLWLALVALATWGWAGAAWAAVALVGTLPLALYTRYYFERRRSALRDARTFLVVLSRTRLKAQLVAEGEALAAEIEALAQELRPRVAG